MAYDESQNTDHGWSKPRLKSKSSRASASKAAAKDDSNGAKEPGSYTGGLKAKIKARREQEQVKGVSQGIKARSKAFNQKQQEQAAQEEMGSEAISKKRPSGKKKFKSNKLFGLTLLAPGLDECDPEGVAALDGTLAAYLGQAPAQPEPSYESCSARRPSPDEMEPLPMAAPLATAPLNAPPAVVAPAAEPPAVSANVTPVVEPVVPSVAAPMAASQVRASGSASEVAPPEAGQMRPYIPGLRLNAPTESQPAAEQLPVSPSRPPVSPLRPYQGQYSSAATERQPYIPGRRPTSNAGGQAVAPNFGSSTGSVYRAPVSAAPVAASASKNTVLPLPVGRNHKPNAKKEAFHEEGGSNYRSSARANSGENLGHKEELGGVKPETQSEKITSEHENEDLQTEGKSLLELLESVPVAKKNRIGRYI